MISPVSMSQIRTVLSLLELTSFYPVLSYRVVMAKTSSVCPTRVLRNSADLGCQETSEFAIPLLNYLLKNVKYVLLKKVFEFIDTKVNNLFFTFFEHVLFDLWVVIESLLDVKIIWR